MYHKDTVDSCYTTKKMQAAMANSRHYAGHIFWTQKNKQKSDPE
jgi:hypothetical protein